MLLIRLYAVPESPLNGKRLPEYGRSRWLGITIDPTGYEETVEILPNMVEDDWLERGGEIPGITGQFEIHCFNLASEAMAYRDGLERVGSDISTAVAKAPAGFWVCLLDNVACERPSIEIVDHRSELSDAPNKPVIGSWMKEAAFLLRKSSGPARKEGFERESVARTAAMITSAILRSHGREVAREILCNLQEPAYLRIFQAVAVDDLRERYIDMITLKATRLLFEGDAQQAATSLQSGGELAGSLDRVLYKALDFVAMKGDIPPIVDGQMRDAILGRVEQSVEHLFSVLRDNAAGKRLVPHASLAGVDAEALIGLDPFFSEPPAGGRRGSQAGIRKAGKKRLQGLSLVPSQYTGTATTGASSKKKESGAKSPPDTAMSDGGPDSMDGMARQAAAEPDAEARVHTGGVPLDDVCGDPALNPPCGRSGKTEAPEGAPGSGPQQDDDRSIGFDPEMLEEHDLMGPASRIPVGFFDDDFEDP